MANFNKIIEKYRIIARAKTNVADRFEHLIKRLLLSYQVYANEKVEQVWLWSDWLYQSQFANCNGEIDLVALTIKGDYWAIQCQCQNDDAVIDKATIDAFLATTSKVWIDNQQINCSFKLCVLISTTDRWSADADHAFKNSTINSFKINLADLAKININWALLSEGLIGPKVITEPYQLRSYQQTALDAVHEYFKINDRGKLIMACGTGKTFTALRIAEHETNAKGFVLYLVPSIALLRQTFLEWRQHSKYDINFVWICNDSTASRTNNEEEIIYDITDLPWQATTDVDQIVANLKTCLSKPGMTVVFATYQSIDAVNKAQVIMQQSFDLIICDEAHRTTGVTLPDRMNDTSHFIKIHQQQFIQGTKRLYMTATPLIYHNSLKSKLDLANYTYLSMDDETNYGHEIYRLSIGQAIEQNLLTNYKLMILTIDKKDLDPAIMNNLLQYESLLNNKDQNFKNNLIKVMACINAFKKMIVVDNEAKTELGTEPMQRAVAFCNTISDSITITNLFNAIRDYELLKNPQSYVVSAQHIDGTMSTMQRDKLLTWLEQDLNPLEGRLLTNVRCLNEGIDIPSLDAILLFANRNSKIDIVKMIGSVMRKSPNKKFGYIIIPIIVNEKISNDDIFTKNYSEYQTVWNVINALLAHDQSFDNEISKLTYTFSKYKKHDRLIISQLKNNQIQINEFDDQAEIYTNITDIRNLIKPKTVTKQLFWLRWVGKINKIYDLQKQQIANAINNHEKFRKTFNKHYESFKAINQHLSISTFTEMIAQYVIIWPIFDALFENNVAQDNPINKMLDGIVKELITVNDASQKKLTEFYESISLKIKTITNTTTNKQTLIMDIYHKCLTIAFPKEIAKLGIVYTPTPMVDFIVKSVTNLLPIHFQNTTINDRGVYIIDPFVGTGSFITRLLTNNLIDQEHLLYKYTNEIYANEINLLAYYVALMNIINCVHDLQVPTVKDTYTNFSNMKLLDTFQTTETNYHHWDHFYKTYYQSNKPIDDANCPPISVIIGNPPYSVGQSLFNDQHQNISYPILEKRIADTYVAQSSSRLNSSLYDSYYQAFRWSTDRLHPQGGGMIGFVTNGNWLTSVSGSGFRKSIAQEYQTIYVINLRGNGLTSGETWRKEGEGVFGASSRASVVIVFLINTPVITNQPATIYYYAVDDYLTRQAKFDLLNNFQTVTNPNIPWTIINPDDQGDWIDQVSKWPLNASPLRSHDTCPNVFNTDTRSFTTARDHWVINFDKLTLQNNVQKTINFYETERWRLAKELTNQSELLSFIYDTTAISWSRNLLKKLQANVTISYDKTKLVKCQYRPFIISHIYFASSLIEWASKQQHQLFLTKPLLNRAIIIPIPGLKNRWSVFITNQLFGWNSICFPEYTYQTNQDNTITTLQAINNQIVDKAQSLYNDATITHIAIFDYLYGLLHHPMYQSQYQHNLQKDYPNLIWVTTKTSWWTISNIGRQLAELHLNFATIDLNNTTTDVIIKTTATTDNYYVTKMKYDKLTNTLMFNNDITITNLPTTIHGYQVFGRSPLQWIIDYYQVTVDQATGIKNDPNQLDNVKQHPRYLLDLVLSIINLTTQTLLLIDKLTAQTLT